MTEISVKTKLWSLIAIMLLLIISVGAVGFVTLDRGAATLKEFVDQDEALQNLTDRVHLHIIQLRRFEKDYFLNIGNPEKQQEYLKKYQAIDAAMPQLLGNAGEPDPDGCPPDPGPPGQGGGPAWPLCRLPGRFLRHRPPAEEMTLT